MWLYYTYTLTHLKCSHRLGLKAPHKSIFFLSILDLVDANLILDRRFHLTPLLIERFEINWRTYVDVNTPFRCNIWNPLTYLEEEIIRKRYKAGCKKKKITSIQLYEQNIDFLEIPSDLWDILLNDEKRKLIRSLIIENYIINKYTSTCHT